MREIDLDARRELAGALFNRTWDLIDQPTRTPDDDVAMLLTAAGSRYHWGEIGGPEQIATAHEGMARACAAAGDPDGRERHLDHARQALTQEPDDEERALIEQQLATVPEVSSPPP